MGFDSSTPIVEESFPVFKFKKTESFQCLESLFSGQDSVMIHERVLERYWKTRIPLGPILEDCLTRDRNH